MAEVWLGTDVSRPEGASAALKWLRPEAPVARFEAEIEALSAVAHPGVVTLWESGITDGRPWFAMEHLAGPDLATLGEKLRLRPAAERHARAREWTVQVAEALAAVHRAGLVHRDLKPGNVIVAGRATLVDFGVAAPIGRREGGGFVGSLAWAAPEQMANEAADPRADQFSLGLLLYWLLTGQRPWGDAGRLRAGASLPRPPSEVDPTVPADLDTIVVRLCAARPVERFASMEAVAEALAAVPASDAPILAGRQAAVDGVARAIDRVAEGRGWRLRLRGGVGAGQEWLVQVARTTGTRRGVAVIHAEDAAQWAAASARIGAGEALLAVTGRDEIADDTLELPPLGITDLRRSIFSVAPSTPGLASVAEAVLRLTGGIPALVEALLRANVHDGALVLAPLPAVDLDPFFAGLDLDGADALAALAALDDPADVATVASIAPGATTEALDDLVRRGLAEALGVQFRIAADWLRPRALAGATDPEGLRERAAQSRRGVLPDDPVLAAARAAVDAGRPEEAVAALLAGLVPEVAVEARGERRLLLAALHWHLGDAAGARVQWRALRQERHDPRARARAGIGLGVLALQEGDVEGALDDLSAALVDADIAGDRRTAALACLDLAEARVLHGEPADALRCARRAVDEARAIRDVALQAKASRALGQVLLDLGVPAEAEPILGDASALARAAGVAEERLAAHVLRARATLDARPGDLTAASVALDRLAPWGSEAGPDPESVYPLLHGVRARAHAVLGQTDRATEEGRRAQAGGARAPRAMRLRAGIEVVRAWVTSGEVDTARALAASMAAEAQAGGMRLLAWEAGSLAARLAFGELPALEPFLPGLSAEHAAALRRRFGG